ncbi:MAG: thiol reductase thioredoxin [Bacteroidales bacterium]|nr:thiol reductase thioredoxin [Bacteroidales bacterium]
MKKYIILPAVILSLIFNQCTAENRDPKGTKSEVNETGNVAELTDDSFKELIFDYEANKEWNYEGSKPAIIDFYADWCAPCRQLSPLVEEIAKEYSGRIDIFKVDTEKERMLTRVIGVSALPTLLFIPAEGSPQFTVGVLPKESLLKAINEILLVE